MTNWATFHRKSKLIEVSLRRVVSCLTSRRHLHGVSVNCLFIKQKYSIVYLIILEESTIDFHPSLFFSIYIFLLISSPTFHFAITEKVLIISVSISLFVDFAYVSTSYDDDTCFFSTTSISRRIFSISHDLKRFSPHFYYRNPNL